MRSLASASSNAVGFSFSFSQVLRSVGRALLRPGPVSRRLILRRRWYQKDRNGYPTTGDFIWLDLVWESDEWEPPVFVIVVFVVLFAARTGIARMEESGHAPRYEGRFRQDDPVDAKVEVIYRSEDGTVSASASSSGGPKRRPLGLLTNMVTVSIL